MHIKCCVDNKGLALYSNVGYIMYFGKLVSLRELQRHQISFSCSILSMALILNLIKHNGFITQYSLSSQSLSPNIRYSLSPQSMPLTQSSHQVLRQGPSRGPKNNSNQSPYIKYNRINWRYNSYTYVIVFYWTRPSSSGISLFISQGIWLVTI